MIIVYVLGLYWLPGLILSRIFLGEIKGKITFQIFLSFLATPILYSFLGLVGEVTWLNFCFVTLLAFGLIEFLTKSNLLPPLDLGQQFINSRSHKSLIIVATLFLVMNIIPRLGLISEHYPIGDDMRQMGKTVSVSESPRLPIFYHFPITRMTIYYFGNVGSGLLVKFSNNQIPTNIAWFILYPKYQTVG